MNDVHSAPWLVQIGTVQLWLAAWPSCPSFKINNFWVQWLCKTNWPNLGENNTFKRARRPVYSCSKVVLLENSQLQSCLSNNAEVLLSICGATCVFVENFNFWVLRVVFSSKPNATRWATKHTTPKLFFLIVVSHSSGVNNVSFKVAKLKLFTRSKNKTKKKEK